jgi:acetolactate synthase-1/2/3 large subunit
LPITKHNYLVTRVDDIARTVREALYIAQSGRPGPVLIDITKDAQQSSCVFDWQAAAPQLPGYRPDLSPSRSDYKKALELIRASKRPIILAGHGIILSGATQEVCALVEQLDIPVAVTLLGLGGVPAAHPSNLGMMGMHGEAWVNTAIQEADLLIALGMRFDDRVTGSLGTYAKNAKKIHVDIDPAEINKNVKVDVALMGDLKEVLRELQPTLQSTPKHPEWVQYIKQLKGDSAVRDIQNLPDSGHLYAAHVINDLWRETGGNAVVVTDVGQHQMWEAQYYHHNAPRSLITSGGLGTMGFALPADGGFQMTMAELATIFQEKIKIHIAIINNGYLGMVRQWQEFFYSRNYAASPLVNPDFTRLAEAFGIRATTVTQRSGVVPAIREAREHDGPMLINFKVEQEDTVYPMVPAGADLKDMIRRPHPAPDMEW